MSSTNSVRTAENINIAPLLAGSSAARKEVDQKLEKAAIEIGACVLTGLPEAAVMTMARAAQLNSFFAIPMAERMSLALNRTNPDSNRYWRGYMNKQANGLLVNEMYDVGRRDPRHGPANFQGYEMVAEETPFAESLPESWHQAIDNYYESMYQVGLVVVRSLARALGKDEEKACARFDNHNSTLRLLNYPLPPAGKTFSSNAVGQHEHKGEIRAEIGSAHTDSAALSFLWQTPGGGLQVQTRDGEWLDVPRVEGACSLHIGEAFGSMTGELMPATPHRVLSTGSARQSIGFFLEPGIHGSVQPLANVDEPEAPLEPDMRYGPWILNRYGYV